MEQVFKIINGFAPPIMEDFFLFPENTHNMRNIQIKFNESESKLWFGNGEV